MFNCRKEASLKVFGYKEENGVYKCGKSEFTLKEIIECTSFQLLLRLSHIDRDKRKRGVSNF